MSHKPNTTPFGAAEFAPTHWTTVLAAGRLDSPKVAEALEKLCRAYWYPLYAYVRRRGFDAHEAQDLTQEFFARLLESNSLEAVDRQKGKFRSWLLASMNHFLSNEWARRKTEKRGGKVSFFSLDDAGAETRYQLEPAHQLTPEKIYERRWALTLLEKVLASLKTEYATGGKAALFGMLEPHLSGERAPDAYAASAAMLGVTEGAVRVAVFRLRRRMGEMLRQEIAQTLASEDEIDEELRYLFAALGP